MPSPEKIFKAGIFHLPDIGCVTSAAEKFGEGVIEPLERYNIARLWFYAEKLADALQLTLRIADQIFKPDEKGALPPFRFPVINMLGP